jgi:hypothetical protein
MRFRVGLITGFAVGYYLGAKAGEERYKQMQKALNRAKNSELVGTATDKAKAVIDLGVERARSAVDRAPPTDNGGEQPTPLVVEVPVPPQGNNSP